MVKFLVVAIPAVLVIAIAILSVQNGTPVSIAFLNGETTQLPLGLWLAFALGAGMLGTAILLSLFGPKARAR
ncbi:MAG: LapA family protein [Phormidesmis sp.]